MCPRVTYDSFCCFVVGGGSGGNGDGGDGMVVLVVCVLLEINPRALHILSKCSTTELTFPAFL
jgi:hypothetical protein